MSFDIATNVLRTLRLSTQDIAAMFLLGSRLYNPYPSRDSDYDVLLVRVPHSSGEKKRDVEAVHRNNIDAVILSWAEFQRRRATHLIECMCQFLPSTHILLDSHNVFESPIPIQWIEFTRNMTTRHDHTIAKAEKFQQKGKLSDARKLLLHALRDQRLYLQLQEQATITDWYQLVDEAMTWEDEMLWAHCRDITY